MYRRTTMKHNHLNHCVILNTYKEPLEEHSLTEVTNEFCRESKTRLNTFGKFSDKDISQQVCSKMSVASQSF